MRIGIFGGSFDPPHLGHLNLATVFARSLSLDRCIIIPAYIPPHKARRLTSGEKRLEMCRKTFTASVFEISDIELCRDGKSYTFDTLTEIKKRYPDSELFLAVGTDMLLCFTSWYRWEDILKLCTLVVFDREENSVSAMKSYIEKELAAYRDRVILAPIDTLVLSSTEVRTAVKCGDDTSKMLTAACKEYINTNNLYMDYDIKTYDADIRKRLGDNRYNHSLCVAGSCRELSEKYGEDAEKAYVCGILHDVLKEDDDLLAKTEKYFPDMTALEKSAHKLWHAMAGSAYIKETYGLADDIVRAVRYHTTGRENMTLLEKILFIADFISSDRDYPGVDEMRERAKISLEYAMEEGLRFTIEELAQKNAPIHPDTVAAYNEILLNKKGE